MPFNYNHRIFHNLFVALLCCSPIFGRNLQTEDINAQLVSTIESRMDMTANPCDNFREYSCGNWKRKIPNADEKYIGNDVSILHHQYIEKLQQLLEGGISSSNKIETQNIFNKVRDFYESCRQQEHTGTDRYYDLIKPTADDDWPADGESWNPKEKWNMWSTMGRLAAVGFNHFFIKFDLNQQAADSSYAPHFYPYELDYPRLAIFNDVIFFSSNHYEDEQEQQNQIRKLTEKLADLYTEFGNTAVPAVEMTVTEYQQQPQAIDIFSYLSAYLGHQDVGNISITIHNIEYFRKLADLIVDTPQDVLIDILKKLLGFYFDYIVPDGSSKTSCVHITRKMVPLAMDYLYYQEVYKAEATTTNVLIEKVFKSMQQTFVALTEQHSDELTPEEIECMRGKILDMKLNIGNLPQTVDDKLYEDYFQNWQVSKDDVYGNIVNALKHRYRDSHELLKRKEFSPLRSLSHRVTTLPLYKASSNVVVIPFAYIRYPMMHPGFHELFRYAELGNSIGHEMLNGFDIRSLVYNEEGDARLFNVNDKPKSAAAMECLKQDNTSSLNGTLANLSGFRLAYETYFQQSELPEYFGKSKLNSKQLYFVKVAQIFCANPFNMDYASRKLASTWLIPVVENNKEFKKVFSCHPNFARLG